MAELPKLAVFFEPNSASIFDLSAAARELCRLVWVIGWAPDPPAERLLRRFGEVVDVTGLDDRQIVERVVAAQPDGVMVFNDVPMRLAAAVADARGLRFHSVATAKLLTDKFAQRTALAAANVPGPRFWPVQADADRASTDAIAADVPYPVVFKPLEGMGSRNTYLVTDADMMRRLLGEARRNGEDMLIEEAISEVHGRDTKRFADLLMVDSVVSEGRITHFVIAGHFVPAPPFRGTGSFIPSHLSDAEGEAVWAATEAALHALGIQNGFVNTDLIHTADGFRVLEVNGRIGGQIARLLEMAGAPPLLPEAMRFALGLSEGEVTPVRSGPVAFCAMYQAPVDAERLLQLDGLDAVGDLPGVTNVVANLRAGDALDWQRGTMSRLFTVYGVADDHDHLARLYAQILETAVVRYEPADASTAAASSS
jgi:biotin carboxylase